MARYARFVRLVPLMLLTAASLIALTPNPASANVISVTTTTDETTSNGRCSLREAIIEASTGSGADCAAGGGVDLIKVPAGTFALTINGATNTTGDLDVDGLVTIQGAGARKTFVAAGGGFTDRIFEFNNGGNVLEGVTISGGSSVSDGGGIYVPSGGILTAREIHVTANSAQFGGGISAQGGQITLHDSLVSNNDAVQSGGGLFFNDQTEIVNVTFSGNRSAGSGGGVHANSSTALLQNVTIGGNLADSDNSGGGNAGGLLLNSSAVLRGTVVSGNAVGVSGSTPNCGGASAANSQGYNVVEGGCTAGGLTGPGDTGLPAQLRALANNGGPTNTQAIPKTSPAYNRVVGGCPAADQRGAPRGGRCDSGAYELVFCRGILVNRVGTSGNDILDGTSGKDGILGFGGNDKLRGKGGKDGLCGGGGKDRLVGGGGHDKLSGSGANDKLYGGSGNDKLNGGRGRDLCDGGSGTNTESACEQ